MATLINRSEAIQSVYNALNNSTVTSSDTNSQHSIKVKKVDIERFNGDMKKWPQFKSTFEECFHKRTDIAGAVKFYRGNIFPIDYTEIPDNRLQRWRLVQKIAQQFRLQWQSEYITQMIERTKGREVMENVNVGAVVLVKTDNMPPTHWPLARVTEIFPGDDGRVRNVEVAIGNAKYRRGIGKIAVLPIDDVRSDGACE